jgi:hypothetical protein
MTIVTLALTLRLRRRKLLLLVPPPLQTKGHISPITASVLTFLLLVGYYLLQSAMPFNP